MIDLRPILWPMFTSWKCKQGWHAWGHRHEWVVSDETKQWVAPATAVRCVRNCGAWKGRFTA